MSSPAITITPDASVVAAARLLDRHHIKRLPVVGADERLVGIVTPHDLLRVYLRSGEEIRDEIVNDILVHYLATNPVLVEVRPGPYTRVVAAVEPWAAATVSAVP